MVSTGIGCEGLAVEPGLQLLVADDARGFADQVVRVLEDPSMAQALGRASRQLVEARYGWTAIAASLEDFHESMAADLATIAS